MRIRGVICPGMHRTERGSAGSMFRFTFVGSVIYPALPRSVLCMLVSVFFQVARFELQYAFTEPTKNEPLD